MENLCQKHNGKFMLHIDLFQMENPCYKQIWKLLAKVWHITGVDKSLWGSGGSAIFMAREMSPFAGGMVFIKPVVISLWRSGVGTW